MKKNSKFHSPFERLKKYIDYGDIALRKAIILQAIFDVSCTENHHKSRKIAKEARAWIFIDNIDFFQICSEAKLDPFVVRKTAKEAIRFNLNTKNFVDRNKAHEKSKVITNYFDKRDKKTVKRSLEMDFFFPKKTFNRKI